MIKEFAWSPILIIDLTENESKRCKNLNKQTERWLITIVYKKKSTTTLHHVSYSYNKYNHEKEYRAA